MKKYGLIGAVALGVVLVCMPKTDSYAGIPEKVSETRIEVIDNREYVDLVIAQVEGSYVNIRSGPGTNTQILGKLYNNSVGNFIEEDNGWYKIQSGNCTGYVKAEYCVTGEDAIDLAKEVGTVMARVNTTTLKVRDGAGLDAAVLGLVPIDDELIVVEEDGEWVKVDIEEGYGYVSKEFVDLHTEFVMAESKEKRQKFQNMVTFFM